MSQYLIKRDGIFYYMRRVPQHVRHLDNRRFVKKSLRTRERKIAVRRSILHDDYFEEFWLGLIENDDTCPASSYDLAIKQARHPWLAFSRPMATRWLGGLLGFRHARLQPTASCALLPGAAVAAEDGGTEKEAGEEERERERKRREA